MNVEHPTYGKNYQLTRAALRLRTFTVSELEDLTGAVKNTIYSFVGRVRQVDKTFIASEDVQTLRGRPQKRFTLSESGRKYLAELSFEKAARLGEAPESSHEFAEQPESPEAVALPSDIYEQEQELVLQVDVPGMTEGDLDVRIEKQGLVVSGVRPASMSLGGTPHLIERPHGHFLRSYPLTAAFNAKIVNIDVQNGVLEVVLRKNAEGEATLASAEAEFDIGSGKVKEALFHHQFKATADY